VTSIHAVAVADGAEWGLAHSGWKCTLPRRCKEATSTCGVASICAGAVAATALAAAPTSG
jgi:hypothetical protein